MADSVAEIVLSAADELGPELLAGTVELRDETICRAVIIGRFEQVTTGQANDDHISIRVRSSAESSRGQGRRWVVARAGLNWCVQRGAPDTSNFITKALLVELVGLEIGLVRSP